MQSPVLFGIFSPESLSQLPTGSGVKSETTSPESCFRFSEATLAVRPPQTTHTTSRIRGSERGAGRTQHARGDGFATQLPLIAGPVYPEPAAWGATMCRAWAHPALMRLRYGAGESNNLRVQPGVVESAPWTVVLFWLTFVNDFAEYKNGVLTIRR